jgi:hypothetical protein
MTNDDLGHGGVEGRRTQDEGGRDPRVAGTRVLGLMRTPRHQLTSFYN